MTGVLITAGSIVALCIGVAIAWAVWDRHQESEWRREEGLAAPQRGRHRALKPLPAVIPRPQTEHAPPWDPAPVIEPAALLAAPVADPPADVHIIATGTYTDGRLHSARIAVLPPLPPPLPAGELPDWVVEALGHASTEDALDSIVRRVMLTDGAS